MVYWLHSYTSYLVEEDEEDNVVSENAQAVKDGHLDDKGEKVVDDGVKELVNHHFPGQMFNWLQFVVYVQLRSHLNEPENLNKPHQSFQYETVHTSVFFVS